MAGSTLFAMTRSEKATPSGRSVSRLRALAHRTSDNGSGSWPSPKVALDGRTLEQYERGRLQGYKTRQGKTACGPSSKQGDLAIAVQLLAPWPTPNAGPQNDGDTTWEARREALKAQHSNGNGFGLTLGQATSLVPWPTPPAKEQHDTPEKMAARGAHPGLNLTTAALSTWATPATRDYRHANATSYQDRTQSTKGEQLPNQVVHHGTISSGSPAETAKPGQLNPAFSRWLMGYGIVWDDYAPTAMRSSRPSRRK